MAKYKDSKYSNNNTKLYKKVLEERGIKNIYQFRTKIFDKIDPSTIRTTKYIWKKGDNLFKLANRFYSNKDYWWLIAHFNQKPTDGSFEIGEEILIPSSEIFGRL
jgi:nucleoid-associated protein YgaU